MFTDSINHQNKKHMTQMGQNEKLFSPYSKYCILLRFTGWIEYGFKFLMEFVIVLSSNW